MSKDFRCFGNARRVTGTRCRKSVPDTRRLRLAFCILDVVGDGELHFVERAQALEAGRWSVEAIAEVRAGQYIIYNGETGERLLISDSYCSGRETESVILSRRY